MERRRSRAKAGGSIRFNKGTTARRRWRLKSGEYPRIPRRPRWQEQAALRVDLEIPEIQPRKQPVHRTPGIPFVVSTRSIQNRPSKKKRPFKSHIKSKIKQISQNNQRYSAPRYRGRLARGIEIAQERPLRETWSVNAIEGCEWNPTMNINGKNISDLIRDGTSRDQKAPTSGEVNTYSTPFTHSCIELVERLRRTMACSIPTWYGKEKP